MLLGAAVIGTAALGLRGLPAARGALARDNARTRQLVTQAALAAQAASSRSGLRDSLERLEQVMASARQSLFGGETANVISARVASHVTVVAHRAGIALASLQLRSDSSAVAGLRGINVTIAARGDIRGLMSLLLALEDGPKVFRIQSLSVSQPGVAAGPEEPESLAIAMTIRTLAAEPVR